MLHFPRPASIIGAPLVLAALLVCVTPAGARVTANGRATHGISYQALTTNAVAQNPANARTTAGSALGDLNGVAVEAVIIPGAAIR